MITDDQWRDEPIIWQVDFLDERIRSLTVEQRQIFWPVMFAQYFITKEEAEESLLEWLLWRINDN